MATKKAAAKKAAASTKRPAKRTASSSAEPKAKNPNLAKQRAAAHDALYASDGYPIFDPTTGESRRQYLARVTAETPKVDVKAELKAAAAEEAGK